MAPLPTHVRRYRRAWALTQRELAALIGELSPDSVSAYERLANRPAYEALIALELIFGAQAHDLFPSIGLAVIRAVMDNAVLLRDSLLARSDTVSQRKRRLLDDLIIRSANLLSTYD
jgi:transcriptional regulator with XRE-family HTH domain